MLVNITEYFIEAGREWQVGQNPDVPREVAARWIADGKATADTDGARNQFPVSGASVPATTMFYVPARQFVGSGNAKDLSGNSADAVLQSGLSDANAWASSGYMSSVAGTMGKADIAIAKSSFDLCTQSVIFGAWMNHAVNGAASETLFGNATTGGGQYGFYLSLRQTTGKIRPIVNVPGGVVSALADSTATYGDSADHFVVAAFDCLTGEIKLFCDGVLSNAYAANSFLRTGGPATPIFPFSLNGQAGVAGITTYAGKGFGFQLHVKTGVGLPANLPFVVANTPKGALMTGLSW